jgi:hypothetical protein
MLCYKDITFCRYYQNCKKGKDCFRALTSEVKEKAQKWWSLENGEAPICEFAEEPECYELIGDKNET